MTGPLVTGVLARGTLRALVWAVRFYAQHAWPLLALAAFPAVVRGLMALRVQHQMRSAEAGAAGDMFVALWRGVLLFAIAGLDLLPSVPWWDSIWPGAWAPHLGGRIGAMSGHGLQWVGLCLGIAIVVMALAFVSRIVTAPPIWTWLLTLTGTRPPVAKRRADAIGFAFGNVITIPLTTLLMYAAVARAALCLRG